MQRALFRRKLTLMTVVVAVVWLASVTSLFAQGANATRSFDMSTVTPGSQVVVTIIATDYGRLGAVIETLPDGFTYVSSDLDAAQVKENGQEITFVLLGESSFTYTVTAPGEEGSYRFEGTLRDEDRGNHPVGGVSTITVAAPTPVPSVDPTPSPTVEPTPVPTTEPTPPPTAATTPDPTVEPTRAPTMEPTPPATVVTTPAPTMEPTPPATVVTTPAPTMEPTPPATVVTTPVPTMEPTSTATSTPTASLQPTATPTQEPTATPMPQPTATPTRVPLVSPPRADEGGGVPGWVIVLGVVVFAAGAIAWIAWWRSGQSRL